MEGDLISLMEQRAYRSDTVRLLIVVLMKMIVALTIFIGTSNDYTKLLSWKLWDDGFQLYQNQLLIETVITLRKKERKKERKKGIKNIADKLPENSKRLSTGRTLTEFF